MSDETFTPPPPRGFSFRNIRSSLAVLAVELALAALYAFTLFLMPDGRPCHDCPAARQLLESLLFIYALAVMTLLVFFWWLLFPTLLAPLVVGLALDYRRAARLDGGG